MKDCTWVTAVTNVMLMQRGGKHNKFDFIVGYWNTSQMEASWVHECRTSLWAVSPLLLLGTVGRDALLCSGMPYWDSRKPTWSLLISQVQGWMYIWQTQEETGKTRAMHFMFLFLSLPFLLSPFPFFFPYAHK